MANKRHLFILLASALGLVFAIIIIIGSIGYAKNSYYSFEIPSNEQEEKIKQEIDQMVKEFKDKVNSDIKSSFNLNLNGFSKIDTDEIMDNKNYEELESILFDVIHEQEIGDIKPDIFVKENTGYILEKKSDGSNILYTLAKDSEDWKITKIDKKPGKYIAPPN